MYQRVNCGWTATTTDNRQGTKSVSTPPSVLSFCPPPVCTPFFKHDLKYGPGGAEQNRRLYFCACSQMPWPVGSLCLRGPIQNECYHGDRKVSCRYEIRSARTRSPREDKRIVPSWKQMLLSLVTHVRDLQHTPSVRKGCFDHGLHMLR